MNARRAILLTPVIGLLFLIGCGPGVEQMIYSGFRQLIPLVHLSKSSPKIHDLFYVMNHTK